MKAKPLTLLRDVLWVAYLVSAFLGHFLGQSIPSFVLMSFLGVVYLLCASDRHDGEADKGAGAIKTDRVLGALFIACSVIPLAVMAYR